MRWWADDSDFLSDTVIGTPDVFVFGGLIVPDGQAASLAARVGAVKAKYGHARAPIKWNFKDAARFYGKSESGQQIFASMQKSSAEWRSEIFDVLADSNVTLLVTAIEAYSADKEKVMAVRDDCARRAFANALMRFALHVQEHKEAADVVIDWPAGSNRAPFNDEYSSGYRHGKNVDGHAYSSGPMCDLPIADAVLFASTEHSLMLQLADMVVGATRDFLRACLSEKEYGPGFEMVKKVKDRYRGAPDKIASRGLNVSTGNSKFRQRVAQAVLYDLYGKPRPELADVPF